MNKATEVMMQYVENLKRTYEKDHAELMEFKKLANQNSNRCYAGSIDTGGKPSSRASKLQLFFPQNLLTNLTYAFPTDDGVPRTSRSMSLQMGKVGRSLFLKNLKPECNKSPIFHEIFKFHST